MQHLFALRHGKEANYQICKINLTNRFSPDLNSMEIQDPEKLAVQKKQAHELLSAHYLNKELPTHGSDEEINQSVDEELRRMDIQNQRERKAVESNMQVDIEKLHCSYISFLELLMEFRHVAENDRKRTHGNFVNNMLIRNLLLNKEVENAILACGKRWENHEEARSWFKNLVMPSEEYISYLKLGSPGFEEDRDILLFIAKKIIFKHEVIEKYLEDRDIYWSENRPIIKSLIIKSLKQAEENGFSLQDVSYNFEDDKAFFVRLFNETYDLDEEFRNLISDKAKNWDVERLAMTDRILLEMAIAEMIFFPSIPVKVTINEYIEISKNYSTPKSKNFINGMLDVIAEDLKKNGKVRKSGRGLIDNK